MSFPPAPSTFWPLTLLQGILLVDLGILAIVLPLMFSIPFAMTIGFILVASGIGRMITIFGNDQTGFWIALFAAAIEVAFGFALVGWPIEHSAPPAMLLMLFLFLDGAAYIMLAFHHKQAQSSRWYWLLGSGIAKLIASAMTLVSDTPMVLSALVSISLLASGTSMIVMAFGGHREMTGWLNQ